MLQAKDTNDKTYYYNQKLGLSSWDPPKDEMPAVANPANPAQGSHSAAPDSNAAVRLGRSMADAASVPPQQAGVVSGGGVSQQQSVPSATAASSTAAVVGALENPAQSSGSTAAAYSTPSSNQAQSNVMGSSPAAFSDSQQPTDQDSIQQQPVQSVVAVPEITAGVGAGGGTLDLSQSGGASNLPSAAAYSASSSNQGVSKTVENYPSQPAYLASQTPSDGGFPVSAATEQPATSESSSDVEENSEYGLEDADMQDTDLPSDFSRPDAASLVTENRKSNSAVKPSSDRTDADFDDEDGGLSDDWDSNTDNTDLSGEGNSMGTVASQSSPVRPGIDSDSQDEYDQGLSTRPADAADDDDDASYDTMPRDDARRPRRALTHLSSLAVPPADKIQDVGGGADWPKDLPGAEGGGPSWIVGMHREPLWSDSYQGCSPFEYCDKGQGDRGHKHQKTVNPYVDKRRTFDPYAQAKKEGREDYPWDPTKDPQVRKMQPIRFATIL